MRGCMHSPCQLPCQSCIATVNRLAEGALRYLYKNTGGTSLVRTYLERKPDESVFGAKPGAAGS